MRIIDKNTDFYDFYQNVYMDNTFTFDRRNSFLLTKEMICHELDLHTYYKWDKDDYYYLLLQVCNTFWLFSIKITERTHNQWGMDRVKDYSIELLKTWKNFNKERKLCSLELIRANFFYKNTTEKFVQQIDVNDYRSLCHLDHHTVYNGDTKIEKDIPLFKACGIATQVDALDMYLAFEEYFSLEKSDSERREPLGTTDIDKVESHGFDKKVSFRGK